MATITIKGKALRRGTNRSLKPNDWDDLVTVLNAITTLVSALKVDIAGINAKLDADGGVTDTDYAATWDAAEADPDTLAFVK